MFREFCTTPGQATVTKTANLQHAILSQHFQRQEIGRKKERKKEAEKKWMARREGMLSRRCCSSQVLVWVSRSLETTFGCSWPWYCINGPGYITGKGTHTHTHTHTFNGPLAGTTRVSWYQKGKTNLDFTEARDSEWQWHQLGHMQVCTSLRTDNHASTPPLSFLQAGCPTQPTGKERGRLWEGKQKAGQ